MDSVFQFLPCYITVPNAVFGKNDPKAGNGYDDSQLPQLGKFLNQLGNLIKFSPKALDDAQDPGVLDENMKPVTLNLKNLKLLQNITSANNLGGLSTDKTDVAATATDTTGMDQAGNIDISLAWGAIYDKWKNMDVSAKPQTDEEVLDYQAIQMEFEHEYASALKTLNADTVMDKDSQTEMDKMGNYNVLILNKFINGGATFKAGLDSQAKITASYNKVVGAHNDELQAVIDAATATTISKADLIAKVKALAKAIRLVPADISAAVADLQAGKGNVQTLAAKIAAVVGEIQADPSKALDKYYFSLLAKAQAGQTSGALSEDQPAKVGIANAFGKTAGKKIEASAFNMNNNTMVNNSADDAKKAKKKESDEKLEKMKDDAKMEAVAKARKMQMLKAANATSAARKNGNKSAQKGGK